MATQEPKQYKPWVWVLLGVMTLISLGLSLSTKGADDGGSGASVWERCEARWEANRSFAETDYMTEERYIDNCVVTERDLEDGSLDGR